MRTTKRLIETGNVERHLILDMVDRCAYAASLAKELGNRVIGRFLLSPTKWINATTRILTLTADSHIMKVRYITIRSALLQTLRTG